MVDEEIVPYYVKRFECLEKRYIKCNKLSLLLLYIVIVKQNVLYCEMIWSYRPHILAASFKIKPIRKK